MKLNKKKMSKQADKNVLNKWVADEELADYSRNISYFLNSNCLISVAGSAGVTNHICTKSNIILIGKGGWVDNPKFGFNGESLVEVPKKLKPTYMTNDYLEIDGIIQSLNKPTGVTFFDESKIVNITV